MDADESNQPARFRSNVTESFLPPTPAAVPRGRAEPAGGRGTAMYEVPSLSV